jgi:signal transduction histidine kinase
MTNTQSPDIVRRRIWTYALTTVGLLVAFFALRYSDWEGSTDLHTSMEIIASMLALMVGILGLVRYYTKRSNTILVIGAGFIGTAMLDGYHAIVTCHGFDQLWPSAPSHLIPWSWNASRTFLALVMCMSWLAWRREQRLGKAGAVSTKTVYLLMGSLTLAAFAFFAFTPLPRAYFPASPVIRPEEFVGASLFIVALVGYLRKGAWKTDAFEHCVVLSLIVGVVCQAVFMSNSYQLFDTMFDVAHLLKKVSYIGVLTGLLVNLTCVLTQAERDRISLAKQRVQLERSLDDLKLRNAELDEFTYVASHDLQEPLRKLTSFCTLLERDIGEDVPERAQKDMKFISDSARRMQALVQDLLALSRAGRAAIARQRISLSYCADQALESLAGAIDDADARITRDQLPEIWGDPTMITQLYQNLIGNAVKFVQDDRRPEVHLTIEQVDGRTVFGVRDNGIGIKPEYMEQVFAPFKRLHGRTEYEGTGIGLSICRKTIERHEGELWVESQPGEGTHFKFTIDQRRTER